MLKHVRNGNVEERGGHSMIYDVAIVGTGPAGLSAAINLKLHEKKLIWFGSANLSQRVEKSEMIANYPGISMISGPQLNDAFKKQIQELDLIITDQVVNAIMPMEEGFAISAQSDLYQAKTVLLASGVANVGMLKDESQFIGKGVSYCATCDGFLYKGKKIAVICNSKRMEHEVVYLAKLAEKVYLTTNYECEIDLPNVEKIKLTPIAVYGDTRAQGLVLKDKSLLDVDGIFCMRDSLAPTTLLPTLIMKEGHIEVNEKMETNILGCFAAGDCTGRPYQLAKAIGEGNVAAHRILQFLSNKSLK